MLVRATDKYEELNIEDIELKKKPKKGEEWEITEERFKEINQKHKYVEKIVEKENKKKADK